MYTIGPPSIPIESLISLLLISLATNLVPIFPNMHVPSAATNSPIDREHIAYLGLNLKTAWLLLLHSTHIATRLLNSSPFSLMGCNDSIGLVKTTTVSGVDSQSCGGLGFEASSREILQILQLLVHCQYFVLG